MYRIISPIITSVAIAMLAGACTESHSAPAEVRIFSGRLVGDTLDLALGESAELGVMAYDAAGRERTVDMVCVSWWSTDAHALPVDLLLPSAAVSAQAGWFDLEPVNDAVFADPPAADDDAGATSDAGAPADAGAKPEPRPYGREPEALVVVDVCGTRAAITARSVLSVTGTWRITIGSRMVQDVKLAQTGRVVAYVPAEGVEEPIGEVNGDALDFTMMGFDLEGRLDSPTTASGQVVGIPEPEGLWTAVKHTKPSP